MTTDQWVALIQAVLVIIIVQLALVWRARMKYKHEGGTTELDKLISDQGSLRGDLLSVVKALRAEVGSAYAVIKNLRTELDRAYDEARRIRSDADAQSLKLKYEADMIEVKMEQVKDQLSECQKMVLAGARAIHLAQEGSMPVSEGQKVGDRYITRAEREALAEQLAREQKSNEETE